MVKPCEKLRLKRTVKSLEKVKLKKLKRELKIKNHFHKLFSKMGKMFNTNVRWVGYPIIPIIVINDFIYCLDLDKQPAPEKKDVKRQKKVLAREGQNKAKRQSRFGQKV